MYFIQDLILTANHSGLPELIMVLDNVPFKNWHAFDIIESILSYLLKTIYGFKLHVIMFGDNFNDLDKFIAYLHNVGIVANKNEHGRLNLGEYFIIK
jgi:hydroxymethylpyrimidine pyrophosphatase-like HAD family hydrolase